jgi:pimeloyl-ACP methyl ester carboxylesterase
VKVPTPPRLTPRKHLNRRMALGRRLQRGPLPGGGTSVLEPVECWPSMHIAQIATSRHVPIEDWWAAGSAPMLVVQGLDDDAAPPGNGHALRDSLGERVRLVDVPRAGHFMRLEQPEVVTQAVLSFLTEDEASSR